MARLLAVTPANERSAAAQTIPRLLNEMKVQGVTDPHQKAYILATAEHESHFGANGYNVELGSGEQYEHRSDLGDLLPGDGPKFKGRGDVQITGRAAYTYYSQHLGVDLVQNPIAAIEPKTSAQIAVGGMKEGIYTGLHVHVQHVARDVVHETVTASGGQKLSDYIHGTHVDYVGARAIVNGNDDAAAIVHQAESYAKAPTTQ